MTLADLRARLRSELGDETPGAYVWSNVLLDGFLGDAVERLGEDVPLQQEEELAPSPDGTYLLPPTLRRLHAVEVDRAQLAPSEYEVWAGTLRPTAPSSLPATVRYTAARERPAATGEVGLRHGEEAPVVWLAAAHAMGWLAKQREKVGMGAQGSAAMSAGYQERHADWLRARRRPLRRGVMTP